MPLIRVILIRIKTLMNEDRDKVRAIRLNKKMRANLILKVYNLIVNKPLITISASRLSIVQLFSTLSQLARTKRLDKITNDLANPSLTF